MEDTMTVIELLNKVANKVEAVPKRIKYGIHEYEWVFGAIDNKWCYARRPLVGCCMIPFKDDLNLCDWETLNSTVTILEWDEDESTKTLTNLNCTHIDLIDPCEVADVRKEDIIEDIQTLQTWVNKIIKEINK